MSDVVVAGRTLGRLSVARLLAVLGLVLGVSLLLVPTVTDELGIEPAFPLIAGVIGLALLIASGLLLPTTRAVRVRACLLLGTAVALSLLLVLADGVLGWSIGIALRILLCLPLGIFGWFVLRHRPARSYPPLVLLAAAAVLAFILTTFLTADVTLWLTIYLVVPLAAVIAVVLSGRIAAQAPKPQQAPAPGNIPATPVATNTFAILALVFGIAFGWLAVIFGHIALSQIKTSGERGRGLAMAGLVLGYAWVATTVILVIVVVLTGAGR